jgi:SAM-dependent methyltransferase
VVKEAGMNFLEWDASDYLKAHVDPVAVSEHVQTIIAYEPFVIDPVLDWGCCDCVDGITLITKGHQVLACDVVAKQFAEYIPYSKLDHQWTLPYESNSIGTVIGSGVIEHVPFPNRSLEELWRIIKPGGRLVLSYIPQRYGTVECVLRTLGMNHHQRRYTRISIVSLLNDNGFSVDRFQIHSPTPMLTSFRNPVTLFIRRMIPVWLWGVWPIKYVAQNAMVIASKVPRI